uniref:Uncharacterized protein n=1 Tax=Nomascus leucogenys TaxID=61853 RepID=A0A2I3HG28_NOMLE
MATSRAGEAGTAAPSAPRPPPPAAFPGITRDQPARSPGIRTPGPSAPERPGSAPGCLQWAPGRAPGGPRSEHPVRGNDDPAREAHGRQELWQQPQDGARGARRAVLSRSGPAVEAWVWVLVFLCGNSSVEILLACHTTHPF